MNEMRNRVVASVLRDASFKKQNFFICNYLKNNMIGLFLSFFNGKSLRFFHFSVLLAVNKRFSHGLEVWAM